MKDAQLKIYHLLPWQVKFFLAGLHGQKLKALRFGPDTRRLVDEALERESWSEKHWNEWRSEKLAFVLNLAASKVPYYRQYWNRQRGNGKKPENLQDWPILAKEEIRKNPRAFITENTGKLVQEMTSGTSGKPLALWSSPQTIRNWYALVEARCRRWHGVSDQDPWAILGGQLIMPASSTRPPFWVWNSAMNQLYLSSIHLRESNVGDYARALEKYKIKYLYGYSSSLNLLAEHMSAKKIFRQMKVVITNAEPLFPHQRENMEKVFLCPARESYGMAERVAAASECEYGRMHAWPEAGMVEVLNPSGENNAGDLVCTGLLNPEMPLIRYQLGDRGVGIQQGPADCKCGRLLPFFGRVEGRDSDLLETPDGRKVYWVNPVFYGLPVKEAQIIQLSRENIEVLCSPGEGFTDKDSETIIERLKMRVGGMKISVRNVPNVPREKNGKYRSVINQIKT